MIQDQLGELINYHHAGLGPEYNVCVAILTALDTPAFMDIVYKNLLAQAAQLAQQNTIIEIEYLDANVSNLKAHCLQPRNTVAKQVCLPTTLSPTHTTLPNTN